MKWSYSIAKVAGIDVRVHVTFLLLVAWWGYIGYQAGGAPEAKMNVLFILLLFLCVLLHEFGHALAARAYGIRTPDITLYPIGGVARLERMPRNPMQELAIAIAGPLVNVAIALMLWLGLGMPTAHPADQIGAWRSLAGGLLQVNLILIAFNLIPAFPMDGGRVLRALLAMRLKHDDATRIAAFVGQGAAIVLAAIGIFGIPDSVREIPVLGAMTGIFGSGTNLFLLLIAMFIFSAARQEGAFAGMRAATASMRIADAMVTQYRMFATGTPAAQAAAEAEHDTQPIYPVTDASMRPVGMVLRNALLQRPAGTLDAIAQKLPAVRADATFEDAFHLMQDSGSPVLPVVNPGGQLVGLVSLHLLSERARHARS